MDIIYLSPHLDDAALSCGGLIWQQVKQGHHVQIWTLCAGDPQPPLSKFALELHQRWEAGTNPVITRRQEDKLACQRLGAGYRHFPIPDCIYRTHSVTGAPLYNGETYLFGKLNADEEQNIMKWSQEILGEIPQDAELFSPLSVGGHVDHKLTRRVAEIADIPVKYYADYPYAAVNYVEWKDYVPKGHKCEILAVSPEALRIWKESIAAYSSQISTFWGDILAMEKAIEDYCRNWGGIPAWNPA